MYQVPDQSGRRVVVTGANSGTGKEATARLAAAGAEVVMACRSVDRAQTARDEILAAVPEARLEVRRLDLADLASVREFAGALIEDPRPVHVLVNNAGVMAPPDRLTTADGFELQWGSNFLGPFALTNLLLPKLLAAPEPRVVTMSSSVAAFARINFRDVNWEQRYRPEAAYGQSKLADLLMTLHLAKHAADHGLPLLSVGAHPGYTRTNLQSAGAALGSGRPTLMSRFTTQFDVLPSMDAPAGTGPLLMAATDPAATNGDYFGPSGRFGMTGEATKVPVYRTAQGPTLAASVWAVAEAQTGVRLPR